MSKTMEYVLASLNPPSIWNFYPTAEAATAQADAANTSSQRLTASQGAPERHYEVMTYDAYKEAERKVYLSSPLQEISAEQYHTAFEVLPPEKHESNGALERFCMVEHWSGPYTSQYAAYHGRYFTRMVDASDRATWITREDISAFMQSQPQASKVKRPERGQER